MQELIQALAALALADDEAGGRLGPDRAVAEPLHQAQLEVEVGLQIVASERGIGTRGLQQGVLDGRLWFGMSGFRIYRLQGDVMLRDGVVQVDRDKPTLAIDYHARLGAARFGQRWRVSSKVEALSVDGESVPSFDAEIDLPVSAEDDRVAVAINDAQADIESARRKGAPWEDSGELVRRARSAALIPRSLI